MNFLVVPPAAERDPNSVQMLSAWIAERGLHCTLKIGMWQNQGIAEAPAWGKLLADAARHVANALEESTGAPASDTISEIWAALDRELGDPSSDATGFFSHGRS